MFRITQLFGRREKHQEQYAEMLRTGRFSKRGSRSRPQMVRVYRGLIVFAAAVLVSIGMWGVIR